MLGGCIGAVRAFFPARGRAAILPDVLWVGAVLTAVQSYAAGESYAGVLRWYMAAAAFAGAGAAAFVLGAPLRAGRWRFTAPGALSGCGCCGRPAERKQTGPQTTPERKKNCKSAKRTCQTSSA